MLRKALTGDVQDSFKSAAETMIDAWSGLLIGCGVQLEVHSSGFLQRPVLLSLEDGDGGIVLNAGAQLPAQGAFAWRAEAPEVSVQMQQGQTGGGSEPRRLGAFLARGVSVMPGRQTTIDCNLIAQPDGALHFRASQEGRKLQVGWAAAGLDR